MIQHNQVGGISKLKELCFFNTTIKNNRLNKDIKDTFKNLGMDDLNFWGTAGTSLS